MAGFDNGVSSPGGMSYAAPLLNFAQFGSWAVDDPYDASRKQQEQQLNQQAIQARQHQFDLTKTFQGGVPGNYAEIFQRFMKAGDFDSAMKVVPLMQQQQAANAPQSPMLTGGAPSPQGAPAPARPSAVAPANSPQGDPGKGTVASLVTDRLPNQDATTGQTIGRIAQTMGIDPNATLTPGQLRRAQGLLQKYAPADAAAGGDGGGSKLPPSANAVSASPPPAPARPQATPVQGAAAPAPGPQPQPAQGAPQQPQQPIMPQVPLPKGFTDPQQAILALKNEAARVSRQPGQGAQADAAALKDWADRIEKSIQPKEVHAGTTLLGPNGQVLYRAPTTAQSRAVPPEVLGKLVDGVISGELPPDLKGLYSNRPAVEAGLHDRGFNLSKALLEMKRAEKQISSLNGPQMTRFVGLASSVDRTIDEVRELSERMENSGIPLLNKGKLTRYMQLEGNSENGQLAARYIGAVNTLKEEFANLAQGGYAPTEAVWKLANDQVNGDYGVKQMGASLDEIQRLIRYRVHAIPGLDTMGPGAANRYTGQGGPQGTPPAAAPAASAASKEWVRGPDGKLGPAS